MEIYGVEQSLDPMGLPYRAINPWIENFDYNFGKFKESILDHFNKIHSPESGIPPLDKVVIDFRHMDEIDTALKQKVLDYIESPTFEYKQYVNDNYLIKLNF